MTVLQLLQTGDDLLRIMARQPADNDTDRPNHIQPRMRPPDPFARRSSKVERIRFAPQHSPRVLINHVPPFITIQNGKVAREMRGLKIR